MACPKGTPSISAQRSSSRSSRLNSQSLRYPARKRMFSSSVVRRLARDLGTSTPRDSTIWRVHSKVKTASGFDSRRSGLTSTTTGPCSVISRSGMCLRTFPSCSFKQEGLGHDAMYGGIAIGEEQPRQFKARLVDHVVAHRRGPIGTGVVLLPLVPAERSPWCSGLQQPDGGCSQARSPTTSPFRRRTLTVAAALSIAHPQPPGDCPYGHGASTLIPDGSRYPSTAQRVTLLTCQSQNHVL
jgi:hypothetical protein